MYADTPPPPLRAFILADRFLPEKGEHTVDFDAWENKLEKLKKYGRIKTEPWATVDDINSFEECTGICIPALYREWIQISDGGYLFPPAGLQLYGVSHHPLIHLAENVPADGVYAVVGEMPYGDPVLFKVGSEEFMLFNQEDGCIEQQEVFPDFSLFLDHIPSILGLED